MTVAISHILVPVDFSTHSKLSLQYALTLASRFGASVELFHVVEDPVSTSAVAAEGVVVDLTEMRDLLVRDGERQLEEYRGGVDHLTVPVLTTVRLGSPAPTIIEYARAAAIDLIVMGTRGRGGFAHLFLGSVAERVIRHASCPVVTMRDVPITERPETVTEVERVRRS